MEEDKLKSLWHVLTLAALLRCPNCGGGKLFASYLKQVEQCEICSEKFGHIRADDGPAWLTILIVGHILGPFILMALPNITWPDWAVTLTIISMMLTLALVILPRAKGVFIAIIWRSDCAGAEK